MGYRAMRALERNLMRDDAPLKFALEDELCGVNDLCVRALVRRAFGLFWDHALLLVSVHIILLLILVAGTYLLTISGNVLLGPFLLGAYKIALRIVRNQNTDLSDILSGFEYFLPAFLANILIHIVALLLAPVFPLVFLTYSVTYLFILEENLSFWSAMEKSRRMVWGNFKRWLVLGLVIIAVNLAGFLCFAIGLLATLPFSYLLTTLAYEEELISQRRREGLMGKVPPVHAERIAAEP
jgi:uncharacterized membrane protein